MEEYIKLRFMDKTNTIELELPPKPKLLKDTIKLLRNTIHMEHPIMRYDDYDKEMPEPLSTELTNKKGFKRIFKKLCADYGDRCFRYTKIPNKISLEETHAIQTIDAKELKVACNTAFMNMNKKNVKMMIIHVASSISDDEKDMIIDKVAQEITMMPIIKFKSNTYNKHTLIEMICFGIEIEAEPNFLDIFK